MNATDSIELLRRYAEQGSESAFHESGGNGVAPKLLTFPASGDYQPQKPLPIPVCQQERLPLAAMHERVIPPSATRTLDGCAMPRPDHCQLSNI
jgi:hypothetical protein